MKLTDQEFSILAKYEEQFTIARRSHYARGIGRIAAEAIHSILCKATGKETRLNASCSSCIFNLLIDAGNLYFSEKTAREAEKRAPSIKVEEVAVQPQKVEIKTDSAPKNDKKPAVKKSTAKKTAKTKAKK